MPLTDGTMDRKLPPSLPHEQLHRTTVDTPIGTMTAVGSNAGIYLLEFNTRRALTSELRSLEVDFGSTEPGTNSTLESLKQQVRDYFAGRSGVFQVPTIQHGSEFEEGVWQALKQIPSGQTRSYGDIAKAIGRPEDSREVGQANGANRISIIVPCHRVIGADGSLVGYGGGLWRKKWLLDHEKQYAWASFERR